MQPSLLIASPTMKDPFFERSVVLIWHHDEDGAIGVIINRPLGSASARGVMPEAVSSRLADVIVLESDTNLDLTPYADNQVSWGGPVDLDSGTIITAGTIDAIDGWILPGGLAVTRSQDALIELVRQQAPLMLCLGYAGWGPGQLDQELRDGGWLFTDVDAELVLSTPPEECWERAIASLGLRPEIIHMTPIEA